MFFVLQLFGLFNIWVPSMLWGYYIHCYLSSIRRSLLCPQTVFRDSQLITDSQPFLEVWLYEYPWVYLSGRIWTVGKNILGFLWFENIHFVFFEFDSSRRSVHSQITMLKQPIILFMRRKLVLHRNIFAVEMSYWKLWQGISVGSVTDTKGVIGESNSNSRVMRSLVQKFPCERCEYITSSP